MGLFASMFRRGSTSERMDAEHEVVLYTRPGCCLCNEAEKLLREVGLTPRLVDIDGDDALREKYGCCIPVVAIDGKVRFRGAVDKRLLRRLLSRRKPSEQP
ncbi:MAG: glutaredoxin family protein [Planctomycetales bacterium]|nr:glutaredoxin family protein [Planctomycetales bacterium]